MVTFPSATVIWTCTGPQRVSATSPVWLAAVGVALAVGLAVGVAPEAVLDPLVGTGASGVVAPLPESSPVTAGAVATVVVAAGWAASGRRT